MTKLTRHYVQGVLGDICINAAADGRPLRDVELAAISAAIDMLKATPEPESEQAFEQVGRLRRDITNLQYQINQLYDR